MGLIRVIVVEAADFLAAVELDGRRMDFRFCR
jgi:hypothetical protein